MGNRYETQDRLIQATRKIIVEEGVEATTLEHICKVAGFTRGAFYSNFSSKDSLLAAMAEDEYADLVDRLRATVDRWAAAEVPTGNEYPQIENLLFEALDAIGIDNSLYVIHSELLSRSIRDPQWGATLKHINDEFVAEMGNVLEWIVRAAHRELTIPLLALVHSVIGIGIRAAGIRGWQQSAAQSEAEHENGGEDLAGVDEILKVIQIVIYAASKPL
ncbi:MAG: TetR/AcrR family transcriptional regulator [Actinomycetaceae bacterium]|nr:TetR/AcrR family transcriptional regulator [Actinomycetaceae bacterium]